ncbi:hypothetical protein AGABI1DRAFT_52146, partial [Agaricus bisporus var. burnettii JB137-S8]
MDTPTLPHPDSPEGERSVTPGLQRTPLSTSPMPHPVPVTRTVAIIKHHALHHRFDIEPRIQGASFEIVKERQMEFDVETDPDALYDLFGEDADSLAEGPVWVYVLERKRAVEVWNTLMGDIDPLVARVEAPNSLRALYGISREQNGLMGSPDTQTAEVQISALFASSPPFRTSDLPFDGDESQRYDSVRSLSSSVLESLQHEQSEAGYTASSVTGGAGSIRSNGKLQFKARPIPATNAEPDIKPRMTRAASLRITGATADARVSPSRPRVPLTKERIAETFANVPGHKRASSIAVASTAPPAIAPRMTKAAALRMSKESGGSPNGKPKASPMRRVVTDGGASPSAAQKAQATFEGVPGHKRRETISVASVKPPTVAPRLNKSAALRQNSMGTASPGSPAISRTTSSNSLSPRRQSLAPPTPHQTPSTPNRRSISALDIHTPKSPLSRRDSDTTSTTPSRSPSVIAKSRPRPSSVILPPSITPRTNRSAALRAAKQEAEALQAEAAAKKKKAARNSRAPPSSFK